MASRLFEKSYKRKRVMPLIQITRPQYQTKQQIGGDLPTNDGPRYGNRQQPYSCAQMRELWLLKIRQQQNESSSHCRKKRRARRRTRVMCAFVVSAGITAISAFTFVHTELNINWKHCHLSSWLFYEYGILSFQSTRHKKLGNSTGWSLAMQ